ncbi:hypothetical protein GCM10017559_32760 [Streptosporangium longisporum]|uniref:Uncharacterized protein n=1 Tax=Streptosporangium longisporum TaxID=46187 RepID=A0ABP6KF92_9ACTN
MCALSPEVREASWMVIPMGQLCSFERARSQTGPPEAGPPPGGTPEAGPPPRGDPEGAGPTPVRFRPGQGRDVTGVPVCPAPGGPGVSPGSFRGGRGLSPMSGDPARRHR